MLLCNRSALKRRDSCPLLPRPGHELVPESPSFEGRRRKATYFFHPTISGSMISEEEAEQIEAEDKLSAVEEVSRTPSPIRASQQPSTSTAFTAKRHSIFMPRKISSDQSSQSTAIENQPGQGPVPSSFVPLPQPQTAKVDAQGKAIPAQTAQPMQAQP
ncbi:hypothetical protein L596_019702 [Steinernema carpocapsae]|uniref:Uncharacterized protein n=1 Tax=Steinernema carpocapsae TaxID=34508 RepID=A0A4V6A0P5_STECR|nr:hypothetical protein L596_019702 [Steinernema carpocapsae]